MVSTRLFELFDIVGPDLGVAAERIVELAAHRRPATREHD
jgi:hypothetical protein